ncbi:MAG: trypsin-like serine protease, partial [Pseudomonadota bacterium]
MTSAGVFALAGALAATPAYAENTGENLEAPSERDIEESVEVSFDLDKTREYASGSDTQVFDRPAPKTPSAGEGTFAGVQGDQYTASLQGAFGRDLPSFDGGFIGTITRPDPQLLVRDDVGVDFGDPDNTVPSAVQLFVQRNSDGGIFFNCTGTVINPRTILTAAHCLNGSDGPIATTSSETYGLPGTGAATTVLVATGQSSADRLFTYIGTGAGYDEGGVASSTDVIIHPTGNADNTGLGFPWADVALVAVDSPITDVPSMPILLSPLSEVTHVIQVGYGTNGTGLTGGTNAGSRFLRRVGENMLGMLGSTGDFIDGVFPAFAPASQVLGFESQPYYWTDFDNPDRTPEESAGCDFPGTTISCDSLEAVFAIDFFTDDALPGEAGTAPGDSGSALIADEIHDVPVVIGVLSGGFDFFNLGGTFSDVSFYNPLFPFFEFITENTSYKYVSANAGDGNWSDPTHWTQDLDPGFLIDDGTGNLINGIPGGNEPGIFDDSPRFGTILGTDIAGGDTTITPGFEGIDISVPESSVLLGPGSTGFVPNNTDGTIGTAFENPAQYFEVHLNRAGTTTVDMDVEIDRLIIDSADAGFVLQSAYDFSSLINVEQFSGTAVIDGDLSTPFYFLVGGALEGDGGTLDTTALLNVAGLMSAGGTGDFGTLNIGGDYLQTSGGTLWADFSIGRRRAVSSDFYDISGVALLGGNLVLSTNDRRVRFGTEFSILSADAIDGDFDAVAVLTSSPILNAVHRIEGNEVVVEITARSIRDLVGRRSSLASLGATL